MLAFDVQFFVRINSRFSSSCLALIMSAFFLWPLGMKLSLFKVLWVGGWGIALGQLVIIKPPDLASKFPQGRIDGSTAAFGTPYYGQRIAGKLLFFDKMGCEPDDYHFEIPKPQEKHTVESPPAVDPKTTGGRRLQGPRAEEETGEEVHKDKKDEDVLRTVVMVRRGQCHFVTKVSVAQQKGATAVVIIDNEGSMSNAADVKKIIMADDGWGDGVTIPSLLIGETDGLILIQKLIEGERVIVELAWNLPKATPVQMDQWMSPAFADTNAFLKQFAPYAKQLKHKLEYRPHYVVMTLPGDFKEMCTDETGRFCGWDPDKGGKTTGKDIMEETVRQLCLWETTQKLNETDPDSGFYSEPWWLYVEQLQDECPHKNVPSQDRDSAELMHLSQEEYEKNHTLGEVCSYALMQKVGAHVNQVQKCYTHNFNSFLTHELVNKASSSTAVMINEWRYSGPLEAEQLTRTLCTGFANEPEECAKLFHPSKIELIKEGLILENVEGIPMWVVILVSCVAVLIGILLAGILYWYCIHQRVRNSLRYAIMDEIRKDNCQKAAYDAHTAPPTEISLSPSSRSISTLPQPTPTGGRGTVAMNRAEPLGRKFSFEEEEDGGVYKGIGSCGQGGT